MCPWRLGPLPSVLEKHSIVWLYLNVFFPSLFVFSHSKDIHFIYTFTFFHITEKQNHGSKTLINGRQSRHPEVAAGRLRLFIARNHHLLESFLAGECHTGTTSRLPTSTLNFLFYQTPRSSEATFCKGTYRKPTCSAFNG